jgi:hypothetical protein
MYLPNQRALQSLLSFAYEGLNLLRRRHCLGVYKFRYSSRDHALLAFPSNNYFQLHHPLVLNAVKAEENHSFLSYVIIT